MNRTAYLERINYVGALEPTAEVLRALQRAHLLAVPFENLSIHAKQPIVLSDEALFAKIVERRRGGFCYELNGLFAALLRDLGFDVAMLSAGVANAAGGFGPDFDHMTLLVRLEQRWLVDVGFGDSFCEPLLLDERGEQPQGSRAYRIVVAAADTDDDASDNDADDNNDNNNDNDTPLLLEQREAGGDWQPQYRFTLQPYQYGDYAAMCHYHQTSPQSHFTQKRLCTRATTTGRVTLSEMRLITTSASGEKQERSLASQQEYAALLKEQFGITMPD